ncbi:MAG: nucleotide sugar dehydrogenase [bacterium]
MAIEGKISKKEAIVGIIGLGYVGLPLAVAFAKKGFPVIGLDVDQTKVGMLGEGQNYIQDVDDNDLQEVVSAGKFTATTDVGVLEKADAIFICVPTPFSVNKEPDISYIRAASKSILSHLRKGQIIILKSTTFPETTNQVVRPILEKSGLKVGVDFYLSFSPERIDPGRKDFRTANTPVVLGGVTAECVKQAKSIIEQVTPLVQVVSSPEAAEMSKLLENIFRSVNIALANELATLCDRMGNIDIWEVIDAASTKPFGFMPFYPGPGIGGHCILVDPYYLSWKAREYDFHINFIELAAETNENMPYYVYGLLVRALSERGIPLTTAKVLFLGAAFKKDVDDIRNSPAIKVMEILLSKGSTNLIYNDLHVPSLEVNGKTYRSRPLSEEILQQVDCVVITTAHSGYDYDFILENTKLVIDTRNATKNVKKNRNKIVLLGSGEVLCDSKSNN